MSKNSGSYRNLKRQMDRVARNVNQGSIQTKRRYMHAFNRFCKHLAGYRVQNIKNIQKKHLETYVQKLEGKDRSNAYIKTELAGIRFYFNRIDNTRLKELPTNDELEIGRRTYKGINRKWTEEEFLKFKKICHLEDKSWIADTADFGMFAGLRIHEVTRLDTEDLKTSLEEGYITVKGKGGRIREVPLEDPLRASVARLYDESEPYSKVFVEQNQKTHNLIKEIQDFIRDNRNRYALDRTEGPLLTFHGLRHNYARNEYNKAIIEGYEPLDAEYRVSRLLGHNRPEVTRIYLAE